MIRDCCEDTSVAPSGAVGSLGFVEDVDEEHPARRAIEEAAARRRR
jgi:hypothetical protein